MKTAQLADWSGMWLDTLSLTMDATVVVGLRIGKIARGGPAGCDEARLMVSEKLRAALEMQAKLGSDLTSSPLRRGQDVLGHYGQIVHANRIRLSQ